jgi:uncharacterized protein (UPF0218 family)
LNLGLQKDRRKCLKKPLGELWTSEVDVNVKHLKKYIEEKKPPCFASVGDFVSYHVLEAGLNPNLVVVDNRIMREPIKSLELNREYVRVVNKPGTISAESQLVLKSLVETCKHTAVIVDGEEDLLALPLMAYMPLNSIIVYGQPGEGMVVIKLTIEKKKWAMDFMNKMLKL